MSGLTSSGFDRKRLVDIKSDIETALKASFGTNIDLTPQSGFGQFVGIFSESISDQWESQENVYNSQYPSTAQGSQLSNVVAYNGIERQEATNSTIESVTITGTVGTVIPIGSQASVTSTGKIFITDSEVTIGGGGTITVNMTAVEDGPIEAAIGSLVTIETPIFGWTGINNTIAAVVGEDEETDAELRVRRENSTSALGQNTTDALYARLLNIEGVTDALVFSNGTNGTVEGVPAHQFLSVVEGGAAADIANEVWINTPQGIASYGTTTETITDSQGFSQDVKFTRPSEIDIYFKVDITINATDFPGTGSNDIKEAVAAYGEANFKIGDDVIMSEFYTPINSVSGIESITLYMGLAPSPATTANITIDIDEISKYLTTQVEVNII
jgi:uncharacterized phage protein gp47/JayE